ncbi:22861_t:CDS:10 [Gigaspora margarita]|uniref:22861_t:CDS:1 n=1 Tax=Gigaspora margarita TaxID=4874 RepID=A0ABM8VWQ9_GIGMA|nr:22861_t:CDS:10 [Gigaspora margarita]
MDHKDNLSEKDLEYQRYLQELEDPNYQAYQEDNNLTDQELRKRTGLSQDKLENILFTRIEKVNPDELIDAASKLRVINKITITDHYQQAHSDITNELILDLLKAKINGLERMRPDKKYENRDKLSPARLKVIYMPVPTLGGRFNTFAKEEEDAIESFMTELALICAEVQQKNIIQAKVYAQIEDFFVTTTRSRQVVRTNESKGRKTISYEEPLLEIPDMTKGSFASQVSEQAPEIMISEGIPLIDQEETEDPAAVAHLINAFPGVEIQFKQFLPRFQKTAEIVQQEEEQLPIVKEVVDDDISEKEYLCLKQENPNQIKKTGGVFKDKLILRLADCESLIEAFSKKIKMLPVARINQVVGYTDLKQKMADFVDGYNELIEEGIEPPSQMFLLLGPPGVGKTFIVEMLAQAMDRPSETISMNGKKETSVFFGVPQEYAGAGTGEIIKNMCQSKDRAMVFLFDEFEKCDKLVQKVLGNITDAMVNKKFKDVFFDYPVPINNLIIFCTANYPEDIEPFLLSRLTPVQVKPLNFAERIKAAKGMLAYNFKKYKIIDLQGNVELDASDPARNRTAYENYPVNGTCTRKNESYNIDNFGQTRSQITWLYIPKKSLTGTLDLSGFDNLEYLNCSNNQLTELKLNNCNKLKELGCSNNQLTQIIYPTNPENVTYLSIGDNKLNSNLTVFSQFKNLKTLYLDNNRITGSLEPLKNLPLTRLNISNTDIDSAGFNKEQTKTLVAAGFKPNNYETAKKELTENIKSLAVQAKLELIPYNQFTNIEYLAKANKEIVLKTLTNSQHLNLNFLKEITNHKAFNDKDRFVVKYHGITQNPDTKEYSMVMDYIPHAEGLKSIHKKGLAHCDLHPSNVLNRKAFNNTFCYLTDLGLSRLVSEENEEGKIYGQLLANCYPYSDLDFSDEVAQAFSAVKIYSNFKQRPSTEELYNFIKNWHQEIKNNQDTLFNQQYLAIKEAYDNFSLNTVYQIHPTATTSRLIDTKTITQQLQKLEASKGVDLVEIPEDIEQEQQIAQIIHNPPQEF